MPTVDDVARFLEGSAPPALAEDWDNVGLLLGDRAAPVQRLMTCLTMTGASVAEAIERRVDLVVVHHPLPFRPLNKITTDTPTGDYVWRLARAGVAVYSAHTAFDSAAAGVNHQLAAALNLQEVEPLTPCSSPAAPPSLGAGRCGAAPSSASMQTVVDRLKEFLQIERVQIVGDPARRLERIAVACGSAGEFLGPAQAAGCQCLVTGETRFHTCLEAEARGMGLVLVGHYASERFALETLADVLTVEFAGLDVWASRQECDPIRWL